MIQRPKIGLALSGSAGRAAAHVGIIEVFLENGIPIDVIVGCSSGALVAVSYAAGTMDAMRQISLTINKRILWDHVSLRGARGGLFHFHNPVAEDTLKKITKGLKFEDLPVKAGVTTSDIRSGELITITAGSLTQALKASVALPGLFEPVMINNRLLVDGGLINVVPALPTKQLGADIVIGIDLARTKFLYQRKLWFWRIIRSLRRLVGIEYVHYQIISPLTSKILDRLESNGYKRSHVPNMLRVFFWGVDHSFDVEKELSEEQRACDIMIEPDVKTWSGKWGLNNIWGIYQEGRRAGLAAIPQIRQLMAKHEQETEKVKV
ncbi:MAG: hypothetical protein A3J07_00310 [Candidatus Doudnabacteria bacterium RIFCSPLOWO2_02_FULL_49_13]|uniref:PNPLA domain-containing protein n=1 Tax=Candidatus Doudnabacteria bacterium RIFCSPHIGHO2_12_FULL_48_16 TaxID=1817838 RepID=A0A1F5PIT8_9BACT|nr:MAG: hypothetical protein A3B77_00200 [Candidatus Doudnabacteria bacterium RIFCSPHIGHO2_02_FULL_49_24]OGE89550.1 MAG: hypothetical protein A2760_03460 [Candidatus Doudnabacteria bacterium RIFCSPHIGHO2_01_FULL_50_67]OGE89801.1 MAG: hypothetical protein A3E29_00230 [Candidatus Doudnabacteria bacterium RIFCSPHIGHO2_12_FULL_48_16]OGE97705.1 MAG: hypothetical protein A2990_00710 [Candidatus Doudnabacteria bacterium RIFCSPLOWO2_01_FULL_49_40]OGF02804.1 MAG: hypothetical protein A3J07_00310 [Candid